MVGAAARLSSKQTHEFYREVLAELCRQNGGRLVVPVSTTGNGGRLVMQVNSEIDGVREIELAVVPGVNQ